MRLRVEARAAMLLGLAAVACPSNDDAIEGPTEHAVGAIVAVEDTDFGEVIVDAEGRTLYVFLADERDESSCYGQCASNWPPLLAEGNPIVGAGVAGSLIGTTERRDGSRQVCLNGRPLYCYSADRTSGDMKGQGIGEVWYIVSPLGEPVSA